MKTKQIELREPATDGQKFSGCDFSTGELTTALLTALAPNGALALDPSISTPLVTTTRSSALKRRRWGARFRLRGSVVFRPAGPRLTPLRLKILGLPLTEYRIPFKPAPQPAASSDQLPAAAAPAEQPFLHAPCGDHEE